MDYILISKYVHRFTGKAEEEIRPHGYDNDIEALSRALDIMHSWNDDDKVWHVESIKVYRQCSRTCYTDIAIIVDNDGYDGRIQPTKQTEIIKFKDHSYREIEIIESD